jgi:hypothetical protein
MASTGLNYVEGGERRYRDPSNPTKTWAGVTAVLSTRGKPQIETAKRNALILFLARMQKDGVKRTIKSIVELLKGDEGEDVYLPDWQTARDFGTNVHQVIENIVNGDPLGKDVFHVEGSDSYPVSNTFTSWVPEVWNDFVTMYDVEVLESEQVVASDRWRVAGRFDLLVKMKLTLDGPRKVTMLDIKTNRGGPHGDVAIQNLAYANMDYILMPDGSRRRLPKVEQSCVFWAHENTKKTPGTVTWNAFPLQYDRYVWDLWISLLNVYHFSHNERGVLGQPMNGPESFSTWHPW